MPPDHSGRGVLAGAMTAARKAVVAAPGFSVVVNLLLLTAPLYMMQVYDRALVSGSVETLVALSLLAALLFLVMGILDVARAQIMARVGARLRVALSAENRAAALKAEAKLVQALGMRAAAFARWQDGRNWALAAGLSAADAATA